MTWLLAIPMVIAAVLALATPSLLRALPAPVDDPTSDVYRPLAGTGFALTTFALVSSAGLVAVAVVPAFAPAFCGLATFGVLSAVIDARTGYLPKVLAQASWVLTAAGVVVSAALLGAEVALRAGLGASAATALFWAFWRFGRGFGFGDVRLAPVIGAAAAAVSWTVLVGAFLLGGLLGVGWGLVWQARGRGRAFPYGPALVAGPFLALAVLALAS